MSPNVGNFVHDLVEMAKAMETLPQVEAERDQLNSRLNEAQSHSQALELAIIDYKTKIDLLNAKVRATEAERDDAELRFLELDEKSTQALDRIRQMGVIIGVVTATLDPPKPVPMPEPEAKPESVYTASGFEGQREGNPTSTGSTETLTPTTDAPVDTSPQIANPTEPVASTAEPTGPYSGKRYYDHPTYVPLHDWVAGGGTEADYDWRPNQNLSRSY